MSTFFVYFARWKVCTKDVKLNNGSSSSSQKKRKKETIINLLQAYNWVNFIYKLDHTTLYPILTSMKVILDYMVFNKDKIIYIYINWCHLERFSIVLLLMLMGFQCFTLCYFGCWSPINYVQLQLYNLYT